MKDERGEISVNQSFVCREGRIPHFLDDGGTAARPKVSPAVAGGRNRDGTANTGRHAAIRVTRFLRVITPITSLGIKRQAILAIQVPFHHVLVGARGSKSARRCTKGISQPIFFFPHRAPYVNVYSARRSVESWFPKKFAVSRSTVLW